MVLNLGLYLNFTFYHIICEISSGLGCKGAPKANPTSPFQEALLLPGAVLSCGRGWHAFIAVKQEQTPSMAFGPESQLFGSCTVVFPCTLG